MDKTYFAQLNLKSFAKDNHWAGRLEVSAEMTEDIENLGKN